MSHRCEIMIVKYTLTSVTNCLEPWITPFIGPRSRRVHAIIGFFKSNVWKMCHKKNHIKCKTRECRFILVI